MSASGGGIGAATTPLARAFAGALLAAAAGPLAAGAGAAEQELRDDMVGRLSFHVTGEEDTLLDVALAHDLGFVELRAANPGVDAWIPGAGLPLLLPGAHLLPDAPRHGIVINLADQRLYFFAAPSAARAATFPIGTPQPGWDTPRGETRVVGKRVSPTWFPPPSVRADRPELPAAVPPGPDNPLGAYALDLEWENYVIHGTNRPYGVGRRVSRGCIRLYPDDIAWLFPRVPVGTRVTVVDQPLKLGWVEGELYLEAHPTGTQALEIEIDGRFSPEPVADLERRVTAAAGPAAGRVDWERVREIADERRGVPARITR